jgi:16S rRNA processing protein RimM
MDAGWLPFGVLGRAHGVRGDLLLHPHAPERRTVEALVSPLAALACQGEREHPLTITALRPVPDGALVRFEGIATREHASELTGQVLCLPRLALPPLGPGEFYVEDLIGCAVTDTLGCARGVVSGLFWNGAHNVMVVRADGQEEDLLVPVVGDFVRELDRSVGRVVVDFHD